MCSYTKPSTQTWSPTQQTGKSLSISQRLVTLAQFHKDEQVSQNQTGLTQSHTLESLSQSHKDR